MPKEIHQDSQDADIGWMRLHTINDINIHAVLIIVINYISAWLLLH